MVYPAEEITTDSGAHVLAYGIYDEIQPGISIDEVIDHVRKQGGVSSAPHPFSLLDALREKCVRCDMIEVFNSNNVDIFSNIKATQFAQDNKIVKVCGSDSHVLSTIGRCVNLIDSENNLDGILNSMKHGKIEIIQTGYTLKNETLDHLKFKINNSKEFLIDYIAEHYPKSKWLLTFLLNLYQINQNSYLWSLFYKIAIYLMKRISNKINFQNHDPGFMNDRNLGTMFKMAL
jgi:predicted metal-dependent phosphoesterase TrpH